MGHVLNLKTYFGDDLHDYPENPADLKAFVETELKKIDKLTGDKKFKKLSHLACHFRQLKNYDKAHELFEQASSYFENTNFQMTIVNYLRWAGCFSI